MFDSPLELYKRHAEESPRLTPGWFETKLRESRRNSDEARDAIMVASLRLVVEYAMRRSWPAGVSTLDMVEEGNVVLLRAVETFKGLDFLHTKSM